MLTQQDIEKIIRETSLALAGQSPVPATAVYEGNKASVPVSGSGNGWMFATVDEAVSAAKEAQRILQHSMTLEQRGRIISSIRERSLQNARYLAELAHNETGYGSPFRIRSVMDGDAVCICNAGYHAIAGCRGGNAGRAVHCC